MIQSRKLFSRGEWLTLIGMTLAVISAALVWGHDLPQPIEVGAVVVTRHHYERAGYDLTIGWLKVGWAVVICSVITASLLLFEPAAREKPRFLAVAVAMPAAILILAFLHLGPNPGVMLAIVGALVMLWGGFVRYR